MKKKPNDRKGTANRCPKCASRSCKQVTAKTDFYAEKLSVCNNCGTMWEPFEEAQIWDKDDPRCSFKEPCNNCAFRPGSPEQNDTEKWKALIKSLRGGGMFYCHKGVPINTAAKDGFDYPYDKEGKPIRAKMRLCRGFLKM